MDQPSVAQGLTRVDCPEYPVVREGLVNAVAHRDYRLTGRGIEVRMYDDAWGIIGPGGLPAPITRDEHYRRNAGIVRGLCHWGLGADWG